MQVGHLRLPLFLLLLVHVFPQSTFVHGSGRFAIQYCNRASPTSNIRRVFSTLVIIVALHHDFDSIHVIEANSLVKTLWRHINLLIDLQFLVHDIFGQNDVLVQLLAGVLHFLLLDFSLERLGLLLLLLELDLLGEERFLKTLSDLLLQLGWLNFGRFALEVESIHLLFGLDQLLTGNIKRVILAQVLKERVIDDLVLQDLVFLIRERNLPLGGTFVEKLVVAAAFLLGLLALLLYLTSEGIGCSNSTSSFPHLVLIGNQALLHQLGSVTGKFNLRLRPEIGLIVHLVT